MTDQLAVQTSGARPVTMRYWPPSIERLASTMKLTRGTWLRAPMTEADRSWISHRLTELQDLGASGPEPARTGRILVILLASFPARDVSDTAVQARIAGYRIALDDVPAWAVETAAKNWIRGDGMTPARFAPTPPELRQAALAIAGAIDAEAVALKRLLNATEHTEREITDEQRERVARRFAAILQPIDKDVRASGATGGFSAAGRR